MSKKSEICKMILFGLAIIRESSPRPITIECHGREPQQLIG